MTVGRNICLNTRHMDNVTTRKQPLQIRDALQNVVSQAHRHNRLVQGVLDVSAALHRCTKDVMFVIYEQCAKDRKEAEIQEKLIQAYCTENKVKFLKVNRCIKLVESLVEHSSVNGTEVESKTEKGNQSVPPYSSRDFNPPDDQPIIKKDSHCDPVHCILVRQPEVLSEEDRFLTGFYNTLISNNLTTCPYIRV